MCWRRHSRTRSDRLWRDRGRGASAPSNDERQRCAVNMFTTQHLSSYGTFWVPTPDSADRACVLRRPQRVGGVVRGGLLSIAARPCCGVKRRKAASRERGRVGQPPTGYGMSGWVVTNFEPGHRGLADSDPACRECLGVSHRGRLFCSGFIYPFGARPSGCRSWRQCRGGRWHSPSSPWREHPDRSTSCTLPRDGSKRRVARRGW